MAEQVLWKPVDIACMINEIHTEHKKAISDLAECIYENYILSVYEEYPLFQLLETIYYHRIKYDGKLHKQELIQSILSNNIKLPEKRNKSLWFIDDYYGLWIFTESTIYIQIKINDTFVIRNNRYKLVCIKPLPKNKIKDIPDYVVILKNTETKKNIKMSVDDFIKKIDNGKDVIYEYSDYYRKMMELIVLSNKNIM